MINWKGIWEKIKRFFILCWNFIKNISLKIWSKINKPHGFFLILFYILAVIIIALTIAFAAFGINNIISYILYVISFLSLSYLIYTIIYFAPSLKNNIKDFTTKHKFTDELVKNYGFRTVFFTIISFVINIAYAIFQGVFAILSHSYWYLTLAVYYIIFSVMRGSLLYSRSKSRYKSDEKKILDDLFNYKKIGITLICLTVVLSGLIVLTALTDNTFKYAGLMIYAAAAYTFYKLSFSIYNIIKAQKTKDVSIQSLKNIGFADSLVSLLSLQSALLYEFGTGDLSIFNILTGSGVCILIVTLGIFMIKNSNKKIYKIICEENNEQRQN